MKAPAVGASIGIDRLAELLMSTGRAGTAVDGPAIIIVFDTEMMPEYQKMARELRQGGVDVEIYYGPYQGFKKMKKQMSYADQKNCPIAIMLGSDELEKGVVSVRNLKLGKAIADTVTDKKEWREKTQHEVPRADLVSFVRKLIE